MFSNQSTNPNPAGAGPGRRNWTIVAVVFAALLAFVYAIAPSRFHQRPAPLQPVATGCPKTAQLFVPTNITGDIDAALKNLDETDKYRVLLRLNMTPCNCGCLLSAAACRVQHPDCPAVAAQIQQAISAVQSKPETAHGSKP